MNLTGLRCTLSLTMLLLGCQTMRQAPATAPSVQPSTAPQDLVAVARSGRAAFLARYGEAISHRAYGGVQVPFKEDVVRHLSTYAVRENDACYVVTFDEDSLTLLVWSSGPRGSKEILRWSGEFLSRDYRD